MNKTAEEILSEHLPKNRDLIPYHQIISAMEAYASQSPAGWVRAAEEKPEPFKWVLVYTKKGDIKITSVDNSGKFDDYPLLKDNDKVTHWMRLPEPPKI